MSPGCPNRRRVPPLREEAGEDVGSWLPGLPGKGPPPSGVVCPHAVCLGFSTSCYVTVWRRLSTGLGGQLWNLIATKWVNDRGLLGLKELGNRLTLRKQGLWLFSEARDLSVKILD